MSTEARLQDRLSDALGVALVATAFAIGVVAYDAVPADMVVHYTPSGGVYYGPETLPKQVGLFVVPAVTAVTYVVARVLPSVGDLDEEVASVRPYYRVGTVLLLAFLVAVQAALVLLNVL